MQLTNLNNVVTEGVTIEFSDGQWWHADFMDDVYPDRTCGQVDAGIWVEVSQNNYTAPFNELFVSFTDATVWAGTEQIIGARCREVAVMVAVRDARETLYFDTTADEFLTV